MSTAGFAMGPHPERAVRGYRRCPEEWQVLKRLQEGLTAPSALSSPCIKAESSLWQFTPSSVPPLVLWGSWSSSPLPGPSMSKHEWVQSKFVPHTLTQAHKHTLVSPSSVSFKFSFSLWCTGPIPSAWLAHADKWKSQRSYWQTMESEEDFRNMYPTAINVLNSKQILFAIFYEKSCEVCSQKI